MSSPNSFFWPDWGYANIIFMADFFGQGVLNKDPRVCLEIIKSNYDFNELRTFIKKLDLYCHDILRKGQLDERRLTDCLTAQLPSLSLPLNSLHMHLFVVSFLRN